METVKPAAAPRVHLDFIEGMRASAALMVLLNHAYGQIWNSTKDDFPPPALAFLTDTLVTGHLAVSVFICISGFCLMLPIARGNGTLSGGPLLFFKRRARRILPPYYAALLLALLLIATVIGKPTGSLWDVCIAIRPSDLVSHVLLLQHFFGTGRINYSFWSISLEWQIYFFFPLLVVGFRKLGVPLTALLALALGYSVPIFVGAQHERLLRANLHFFGLFAIGMVAARIAFAKEESWQWARQRFPWAGAALALIALMTGLILSWGWLDAIAHWPFLDLLSALSAGSLLLAAAQSPQNPVRRVFELRPLVSIGRFSYSLYLVHAPILQLVWQFVIRPLGLTGAPAFGVLAVLATPLVLAFAQLFYRLVEAPFVSSRPRPAVAAVPPATN